ncbi:MAG: hypothetical protein KGD57_06685 [Candidatus Lokiarchaeota archaeon]|nr:hypothetical protein [Candidatus Lokiarchaeota archaeon]
MVHINVVKYTYLCPYCGENKESSGYIPMCNVCGEFVCNKCKENYVCSGCLSKLNPEQRKLFNKKGGKSKILIKIFKEVYGPNFITPRDRESDEELMRNLSRKIFEKEDAREEFQKLRDKRVQDTNNPELWK